ncbi:hypothetical protein H9636_03295 [Ureibacillus sp. Re31]|uniref:Uncharacterized protein n=1 Tax=Ureibacillus galli TaxID=2762222 RepID=A0ABR8X8N6_9BACL|nr:hypothetical protein [Ureibacillus galli]MBD8025674.1 hypothetical protein [Ureibacillus galli]
MTCFLASFFAAIVAEEADFEESNFNEEWLDDSNWYIFDNENRKKGIYIPAVYPDRELTGDGDNLKLESIDYI